MTLNSPALSGTPGPGVVASSGAPAVLGRRSVLVRLVHHRVGAAGAVIVAVMVLAGILAPLIAPQGADAQNASAVLQPPSFAHLFGTDELGRDVLSRVIYGAQNSVYIGVLAVGLGSIAGIITGMIAGYRGGWIDAVLSRLWDTFLAFPGIILAILVVVVLGPGTTQVAYAVALVNAPEFFRIVRGSALEQREREYVVATEVLGASRWRVLTRHLFPNSLGPILVQATLAMGFAIRLSAGLAFIGLGTQPPAPSWGGMLQESFTYLGSGWWLAVFPGVALALFLIGLNFLADGFHEILDPRRWHA